MVGAMASGIRGAPSRPSKINDRRFAESIYGAAVASGIMERVAYQDTIAEAG
jgi:hypothetical protein